MLWVSTLKTKEYLNHLLITLVKSLDFLQKGVLKLCICYLQESFITDDIIHSIHYNTTKLNIQNSIVIVNDFLKKKIQQLV